MRNKEKEKEMKAKLTFDEWMKIVDRYVWALAGCSVHDLSDYCFADAYEDGRRPATVAKAAIRNAGAY